MSTPCVFSAIDKLASACAHIFFIRKIASASLKTECISYQYLLKKFSNYQFYSSQDSNSFIVTDSGKIEIKCPN